jgi:Cys-rich peptide (TIGR04165 family)
MKSEEMNRKCPECGSRDKSISTVKYPADKEKLKEAGIDEEKILVGSIRCSSCGYLFEYCKDGTCSIQVKRINIE